MKLNNTAVLITVVVLALIFGAFYLSGYFKPEPAPQTSGQPTANNSNNTNNNQMNQSKVDIVTLKESSGPGAKNGDKLTVNYTGTLTNGVKFDSSLDPGRDPFTLTLGAGQVIKGWDEGLIGMKAGEKRKLTVPAELGYGASGFGSKIPPNSTLIFEVDLLKIN